jgi:hypothetical protein
MLDGIVMSVVVVVACGYKEETYQVKGPHQEDSVSYVPHGLKVVHLRR